MTELLIVMVAAFVAIAGASVFGPRLGIAAPLVLVAVGVAASFLPVFADVHIEPELILAGVLPPLLYSSAVSMPAMNFRREFGAISGLSVILVVGSALVLGAFFALVVPGLGFAWGVALGAIVSPTDAVATSIIKKTPVSKRVVALLDGESLLNDATALVLLRTAIVATAAAFSFWGAVGTFAYSVVVAVVIGWAVGWLGLFVRKRVTEPTVNTLISFTIPFLASVPVEALQASGLVAAVVAGLVTGIRAPRDLSPQNRLSDSQNWRTVELVLEGAVFLTMGIQIREIVVGVQRDHAGVLAAVLIAAAALGLTIVVRAAYVAPLLGVLGRRRERGEQTQERLLTMQDKISTPTGRLEAIDRAKALGRPASERQFERVGRRITQMLADIDYFRRQPLGWREGTVVVWAGMRGAVTVAAAQSLPDGTPMRSMLVLIAFTVAALSLLVQGGTVGWLLKWLAPKVDAATQKEQADAERKSIFDILRTSAESVPGLPKLEGEPDAARFDAARTHRLAVITAQRAALLDARDSGTFDADLLASALTNLDATEISIELRSELTNGPDAA
ncbi:cation:proton antiporter [Gryllotalpicola protaetiae]|uniref:Sodium:proton antiporter n=1 Tax=Gryllotalpicola protaetiae TaxID=2419771 RepID=A0A387BRU4_9MICO|nr:sodium:proton antiporter [Gryllotalpicola protaetiae]AYG04804.1 sodium:proton antiporter [Gryllotalpicola protaetiae]